MLAFRSLLFNVFFYVWLAVILVAMMAALPFPRRLMQNAVRVWAWVTQWGLEIIVGLDYRVVGMDRLPPGPVILASKHQSAWDTHVYHLLFP
ncbi:MAG TPA: 1-acyl-sn-glycerol-3-phosphate acyltransferase, partial [Alphaproteobacteria bacterium]|nr:1-acyl-sn-glycerol-3-phosphate acyltransferase [Alphaproteobacteria bacterium]